MLFEVEYLEDVKIYLDNLKKKSGQLFKKTSAFLQKKAEDSQYHVMPFWKPLGDGIIEIRTNIGKLNSRIYCCFSGKQKIILLCGARTFDKKRQQQDILRAKKLKVKLNL